MDSLIVDTQCPATNRSASSQVQLFSGAVHVPGLWGSELGPPIPDHGLGPLCSAHTLPPVGTPWPGSRVSIQSQRSTQAAAWREATVSRAWKPRRNGGQKAAAPEGPLCTGTSWGAPGAAENPAVRVWPSPASHATPRGQRWGDSPAPSRPAPATSQGLANLFAFSSHANAGQGWPLT